MAHVIFTAADADRLRSACQPVGKLATVAADDRLLVDIQLLHKIGAELLIESRSSVAAIAAVQPRIFSADLALPLGIEKVFNLSHLFRFDKIRIDEEEAV